MFGSFRYYVDRWPSEIYASSILEIIDMFSLGLGAPFSRIIHVLHDPDGDLPKVYAEYSNDESGRNSFVTNEFVSEFIGKYGEASASSVKATCNCDANAVYSSISIEVQLPCGTNPMILRVDFDCRYISKSLNLSTYVMLLSNLHNMGFMVNNSFLHVYRKISTVTTLDGGQIGSIVNLEEKRNIKQAIAHRKQGSLNCVMDVFCINSIRRSLICENTLKEITNVVGIDFVADASDNFIFSLPFSDTFSCHYRQLRGKLVRKLREILCSDGLVP